MSAPVAPRLTRLVLGADDPEMRAIEAVARAAGVPYIYAALADGTRVNAGQAYGDAALWLALVDAGDLLVECGPATLPPGVLRADHHRPGDPGYGAGPNDFWRASSLGQVVSALIRAGHAGALAVAWGDAGEDVPSAPRTSGVLVCGADGTSYVSVAEDDLCVAHGQDLPNRGLLRLPPELPFIAAGDHCLAGAYAGQCPGIDPDALLDWRLTAPGSPHTSEPDGWDGRRPVPPEVVRERAALARHLLSYTYTAEGGISFSLPTVELGPIPIGPGTHRAVYAIDLRAFGSATVGLPIADVAARLGHAYVLRVREGFGADPGPWTEKVVLGGCGEGSAPGVVPMNVWESWCRSQGYLGKTYGDPARGYAGCYIEVQS